MIYDDYLAIDVTTIQAIAKVSHVADGPENEVHWLRWTHKNGLHGDHMFGRGPAAKKARDEFYVDLCREADRSSMAEVLP